MSKPIQSRRDMFVTAFQFKMEGGNANVVYQHLTKQVKHSHHISAFVSNDLLHEMKMWLEHNQEC